MPAPADSNRRNWPVHVATLALFLALAGVQTWPLVARLSDGVVGLRADQVPNNDVAIFLWDFWWVRKSLVELHQSPADCEWLARPGPPAFVFPTLSLVNSVAALPLVVAFGEATAYNVMILAILALTGWSAYLLLYDMTRAWLPAVLAGVLYGTTPLQMSVAGQLNVFTLFWLPLALLAARRFMATGRWPAAVALGVCFLCNALSAWYHAIALALLLAVMAAVKVWQRRSETVRWFERRRWLLFVAWGTAYLVGMQFSIYVQALFFLSIVVYLVAILYISQEKRDVQRLVRRMLAGTLLVGVFALPVVWPMYRAIQHQAWLRTAGFSPKVVFAADLASYVFPAGVVEWMSANIPRAPDYQPVPGARQGGEVFPGAAAWLVLVIAAIWRWRRGRRGADWLVPAGVFLVLSLGPALKFAGLILWKINAPGFVALPGMVCEYLPVFESLRVFLRFAFPAYLCAAIFVGIQAADLLAATAGARARRWATAAMVGGAVLIAAERLDLPRPVGRIPPVPAFEWLRDRPDGTVLLSPVIRNQYENLYSQTIHEKPMVNPYISRRPEDLEEFVSANALLEYLETPGSARSTAIAKNAPDRLFWAWEALRARWLVVDRAAYGDHEWAETADRALREILGVATVYEDERYRIYAAPGPDARPQSP